MNIRYETKGSLHFRVENFHVKISKKLCKIFLNNLQQICGRKYSGKLFFLLAFVLLQGHTMQALK